MPARRPRIAVIGVGSWGRNIVRAIHRCDGVELARVCNRRPPAEGAIPFGVPVDTDWRETIAADIDGVAVATPPSNHAEIGLAALGAGYDLFIEKPLALNVSDASGLLVAAEASGAAVLVDHIYLYHPAWPILLSETARGPQAVDATFGQTGPFRKDTTVLWDWGPHVLALCLDLFGAPPDQATLDRAALTPMAKTPGETVELRLAFGAASATITISNQLQERRRRFTVHCEPQSFTFEDGAPQPLTVEDGREKTAIPVPDGAPLDIAIARFAEEIGKRRAGRGTDLARLRQAVETIRILSALDPCPT